MNSTLRNIQTGVNGTLNQKEKHLHCLQVEQHLSYALLGQIIVRSLFYLRSPTKKIPGRGVDLLDLAGQVEVDCKDLTFCIFLVAFSAQWKWPS